MCLGSQCVCVWGYTYVFVCVIVDVYVWWSVLVFSLVEGRIFLIIPCSIHQAHCPRASGNSSVYHCVAGALGVQICVLLQLLQVFWESCFGHQTCAATALPTRSSPPALHLSLIFQSVISTEPVFIKYVIFRLSVLF